MEVSGQLHASAALPAVDPPVPVESEAGWTAQQVWSVGEDTSLMAVIEPRFLGLPVHSLFVVVIHQNLSNLSRFLLKEFLRSYIPNS
jgi:hypothetical protein